MTDSSQSTRSPDFLITTNRLQISHLNPDNPSHTTHLAHLWNTPDFIALNGGTTSITSPETAAEFLRTCVRDDFARNGYGMFLVSRIPTKADDTATELIGVVTLMKAPADKPHAYLAPDIGYVIHPSESGKGYATEAASGLLEYVQREMGIDAVFGFCGQDDARSARVLEKIEMECRGTRRLKLFGGKESRVFALPRMDKDLRVYGIEDD